MKAGLLFLFTIGFFYGQLLAQKNCASATYQQDILLADPNTASRIDQIENFIKQQVAHNSTQAGRTTENVIRIPVVIHNLYHYPSEKISDAQVFGQIEALNKCFRRRNADTVNTPSVFRPFAADCEIEFVLAKSDPRKRSTSGIVRKYTPITSWKADDKMKFDEEMGAAGWDSESYLNIWVCNLDRLAGYSSFPGGPANKDGIVLDISAFGINAHGDYGMGKTAVHEAGHWLGLKHLWGDEHCGNDNVDDTPKQAGYTVGCPTSTRVTCGNGPTGDMFMNYMDFTSDNCMNLFTQGQKSRMRSVFALTGPRHSILLSKGLNSPLLFDAPLLEEDPKWLHARLYPNPASSMLMLDLAYDVRWIGNTIRILNLQGQSVMELIIKSKNQTIDISRLQPGMYFLAAKRHDGLSIKEKFIKL